MITNSCISQHVVGSTIMGSTLYPVLFNRTVSWFQKIVYGAIVSRSLATCKMGRPARFCFGSIIAILKIRIVKAISVRVFRVLVKMP